MLFCQYFARSSLVDRADWLMSAVSQTFLLLLLYPLQLPIARGCLVNTPNDQPKEQRDPYARHEGGLLACTVRETSGLTERIY